MTSITNTALKIGRSTTDDYIDFSADDNVYVKIDNTNRLQVTTTGAIVNGLLIVLAIWWMFDSSIWISPNPGDFISKKLRFLSRFILSI